ncbi:hypothetical protein YPPY63_2954, partial [Yersinia pestis PY-63]
MSPPPSANARQSPALRHETTVTTATSYH